MIHFEYKLEKTKEPDIEICGVTYVNVISAIDGKVLIGKQALLLSQILYSIQKRYDIPNKLMEYLTESIEDFCIERQHESEIQYPMTKEIEEKRSLSYSGSSKSGNGTEIAIWFTCLYT